MAPDAAEGAQQSKDPVLESSGQLSASSSLTLVLRPASSAGASVLASTDPAVSRTPSPVSRMLDLSGTIRYIKSGVPPASHVSPVGCANILPTHAVIPPKRGLDSNYFVIPMSKRGMENPMVFDGLSDLNFNDLAKLVGSQRVVRDMVLQSHTDHEGLSLDLFETCLSSLTIRREMASILMQFQAERSAERLFYSMSLLDRLLSRRRPDSQVHDSAGISVQDTSLRAKYDNLARDYGFLEAYIDQERKSLKSLSRKLKPNWAASSPRLRMNIQKLEARLESARQTISRLEKSRRDKDFSADKLMEFLWQHPRSVAVLTLHLTPFEKGTKPPKEWTTWLSVETADKPYRMAPPFPCPMQDDSEKSAAEDGVAVSDDDDANADQEGKSEEKPPVPVTRSKPSDQATTPKVTSPSAKSVSGCPAKQSHRITNAMQVIEMETPHGTVKRALRIFFDQKLSIEHIQSRFQDFVTLSDLRQDTLLTMQAGFGYSLAVQMMGDNAAAHHEFPENKLCDMLVQMMYHRCLDDTPWTQHVPDRYFKTAEVTLRTHLSAGVYPPEWPVLRNVPDDSLTAHQGIEIADSEEEDDRRTKTTRRHSLDTARSRPTAEVTLRTHLSGGVYPPEWPVLRNSSEDEKPKQSSPSKRGSLSPISSTDGGNNGKKPKRKVSGKRKRRSSGGSSGSDSERVSGTYTPSPKRPRPRGSNERTKSRLAMLRYEDLTDADKTEIEVVDRGIRNEVIFLKRRWTPLYRQYLDLLAKKPWKVMFANLPKYLYFYLRKDFSPTAVKALDRHIKYMKDNFRTFWDVLHWFVIKTQVEKAEDADDEKMEIYVGSLAIHSGRSSRHETVGRDFEKRLERMFKTGVPRTII
ncbi:hypothetical protein PHMEG_00028476 [Phytophthora megakarya]|uniref:Uncharacterized protein n=1 Tax=Phytophthora megakarya TaxID=4795 RepID=A0A225V5W1_9STRA|nr:hypothetical protein PHMEG_00028476 [Phytophthora megakarya]